MTVYVVMEDDANRSDDENYRVMCICATKAKAVEEANRLIAQDIEEDGNYEDEAEGWQESWEHHGDHCSEFLHFWDDHEILWRIFAWPVLV